MSDLVCLGQKEVVARKPHICYLCNQSIPAGTKYFKWSGIDPSEGCFVNMPMHPECKAVTDGWDDMDWECFYPGDLTRPST